jgi:beta-galactosidase
VVVDDEPRVVLCGEVHYFRLRRADWAHRLELLAAAGCTAVATYIPWLVHEMPSGGFDLTGQTSQHRDLVGFLDLAARHDLMVVARPGPFVMAELLDEGIPARVRREHPELVPTGWDGAPAPTRTLDYLAPAFLGEVSRWYAAVLPVLAQRLGDPVVAVQLDNEIGMLSWVANAPDLTDDVVADFARHANAARHGFDGTDHAAVRAALEHPSGHHSLALHHDLGDRHRDRYRRYVEFLCERAAEHGVDGVPLLVNIHGTGGGRGRTFPVGISQLYRAYRARAGVTSGADHYLGDLTVTNVADLYVGNAFMAAVHDADQPLTSLEFEAGSGDYGDDLGALVPPEAVDLKTRVCVAQGVRLLNYYLFAGGTNPVLDGKRIGTTGERHGFAAPVDPEGRTTPAYTAIAGVAAAVRGAGHLLAAAAEEHDELVLGFVPDHYLTEYHHPADAARARVVADLERFRGMGSRDVLARAMLLAGFSFTAVDLQEPLADNENRLIVLASPPTLAAEVQVRLATYVRAGGRLLLVGVLPTVDTDGTPCTILADALDAVAGERVDADAELLASVRAEGGPEVRVGHLQRLRGEGEPVVRDAASGEPVGVLTGRCAVLACDYPCHLPFWTGLLARLGVRPRHTHDASAAGLVVTSTVDSLGQRLVHLVNVAPVAHSFVLARDGVPQFGGHRVDLPARSGLMLPQNLRLAHGVLRWSTCELAGQTAHEVILRRRAPGDRAEFETTAQIDADGEVQAEGSVVRIHWPAAAVGATTTVRLSG